MKLVPPLMDQSLSSKINAIERCCTVDGQWCSTEDGFNWTVDVIQHLAYMGPNVSLALVSYDRALPDGRPLQDQVKALREAVTEQRYADALLWSISVNAAMHADVMGFTPASSNVVNGKN